jgi:hypothetical protein
MREPRWAVNAAQKNLLLCTIYRAHAGSKPLRYRTGHRARHTL